MRFFLWGLLMITVPIFSMELAEDQKLFLKQFAQKAALVPGLTLWELKDINKKLEQVICICSKLSAQQPSKIPVPIPVVLPVEQREVESALPISTPVEPVHDTKLFFEYVQWSKDLYTAGYGKCCTTLAWFSEHKKLCFLCSLAALIARNNILVVSYRYSLWRNQEWSAWCHKNNEGSREEFTEALLQYYYPRYPDADVNELKGYFLQDIQNELDRLQGYKHAAGRAVVLTTVFQNMLYRIQEGCIGFFGKGSWVRYFFTSFFGVVRADYVMLGNAAFLKDVEQRMCDLERIKNILCMLLV